MRFIRTELNKEIKALEEALKNPTSQGNQYRSNHPPAAPYQAHGPGHPPGLQNVFCTPTGSAAEYFNPASARPASGLPGSMGPNRGEGLNDFRQPSFTSTPWDNNSGAYQTPGGFPSSFDSSGPRVGLQLQGGPPQFLDVNFTEGSAETQYNKDDFPWSRELVVRYDFHLRWMFVRRQLMRFLSWWSSWSDRTLYLYVTWNHDGSKCSDVWTIEDDEESGDVVLISLLCLSTGQEQKNFWKQVLQVESKGNH